MGTFVLPAPEMRTVDTTSAPETITLSAVIGKKYEIVNVGSGGNDITVNYGVDSMTISDGSWGGFLYDGSTWAVLFYTDYASDLTALEDAIMEIVTVDATSAPQAITLADATVETNPLMYVISGTNGVTFDTTAAQTIDGASSVVYSEAITVIMMPVGGNWRTHLTARSDQYIDNRAITQALVFS